MAWSWWGEGERPADPDATSVLPSYPGGYEPNPGGSGPPPGGHPSGPYG